MDNRLSSIIGVATALLSVTGSAIAQTPSWAVGTWKGSISNMRGDSGGPDRVLIIGPDGACKWDYVAKIDAPANAKSCTVAGNAVTIATGGNATVQLQNKGGKMEGTFQARNGNSFHVSLTKQ